jgi:hypothetical protein
MPDLKRIISRVVLESRHKKLLTAFREAEKSVRNLPASATYFVPPEPREVSVMTSLKDKGFVCRHGRFRFERCSSCNRTTKDAQAYIAKLQRMFE